MQKKRGTVNNKNNKNNGRNTSYFKSRVEKEKDSAKNVAYNFIDKSKKRQMSSYIRAVAVLFICMVVVTGFIFLGIILKGIAEGEENSNSFVTGSDKISDQNNMPPTQSLPAVSSEDSVNLTDSSGGADNLQADIADIYSKYNGVYLDVQELESIESLQIFIDRIKQKNINAVNIDIKKEDGIIPYHINGEFDFVTGTENQINLNIEDIIKTLHDNGLYVSGNIACFKDNLAGTTYAGYTLKEASTALRWTDSSDSAWLNIYVEDARNYIKKIVTESVRLGFDEIILSYFYLPNVANVKSLIYEDNGVGKYAAVRNFIMDIRGEIENIAPNGFKVKLGLSIPIWDFLNMPNETMGLDPNDLSGWFNFFTTSFAPSDLSPGSLNISKPENDPYETVKSLCEHFKYLIDSVGFRPIIQAFNAKDGTIYDDDKINKQKQALIESGISVWEIINYENIY